MAAWEERGHQCEICYRTPAPGEIRLHLDHDHQTGRFRGFLCSRCNTGLGQLREDVAILHSAIEYLTRSFRQE
ncbi:endonuclease domain-containing protein [Nonomuraea sp. NPDC047529]|uniref:endonuclease domain-containing protein n=1 Tax=Nonomuraea sp. NPDC047529 TaxID=3155623 RepID=UPI0033D45363